MAAIIWQTPANGPEAKDFVFLNGKRYVRPYYFEFISHVKNRWAGKAIVDLFTEEFRGRSYEYYESAVKCGRIQVDDKIVPVSYVVRSTQKISHFVHRHEPPVLAGNVSILHIESDVITVCKPASIPVHPCGQYRKNTIIGILQAEHDFAPLFPIHRLDRLVSGLLIFARSADKAEQFRQQIDAGLLNKEYIARVIGIFPEEEQVVDANVNYDAREGRSSVEVVEQMDIALEGKAACTRFLRISTNGTHSVVLCKPVTGRTHQIRVHLQHCGHPIANDDLYLSKTVTPRSARGTGANRTASIHKHQPLLSDSTISENHNPDADHVDFSIDPMCTNCPSLSPKGYGGDEEGLWLHCLRYSGPNWSYECPSPDWAVLS
ncbi:RNA pseudouridine synthase 7 isoform X2 [Phalaenopsis equestris]|uniref:RNA pseudouridine synthase 7 isoform X2 n=1 Tax=Phalaenopsis equestris TaxID=78828 RepID=UPI0009E61106|nr:RNA pseudouridine synthase 7 isoform X2 [Phalaenopsis equestris]